jgi:hypothetical protein
MFPTTCEGEDDSGRVVSTSAITRSRLDEIEPITHELKNRDMPNRTMHAILFVLLISIVGATIIVVKRIYTLKMGLDLKPRSENRVS